MKKTILGVFILFSGMLHAQLTLDYTLTPAQLVQNVLVGEGVTPLNIKFNTSPANINVPRDQLAAFDTNFNGCNLGITKGLLMTTGRSSYALGPNNFLNGDLTNGQLPSPTAYGSDPDLVLLSGLTISSSAILEFDFDATGPELKFDFIFASEEYAGYVNSINDTFGFFLSGDGITGPYSNNAKNVALVPNTNTQVSINTINNGFNNNGTCTNCNYYVNNGPTGLNPYNPAVETVEYDGFTKVLTAKSNLTCGARYHIKLAIGNASDNLLDSAVFLKNFRIAPLQLLANNSNAPVCPGIPIDITSGVSTTLGYSFVWKEDGVVMPLENGPNLHLLGAWPGAPVTAGSFVPGRSYQITSIGTTDYTLIDYTPPGTTPVITYNVGDIFKATGPGTGNGQAIPSKVYTLSYYTPGNCLLGTADYPINYFLDSLANPAPINICAPLAASYSLGDIDPTLAILNGSPAANYDIHYYFTQAEAEALVPTAGIPVADLANFITTSPTVTIWVRLEDYVGAGCITIKSLPIKIFPDPSGTFSYPNTPYCGDLPTQAVSSTVTTGGTYTATPAGLNINPTTGDIIPSLSTPGTYTVSYFISATATCPAFSPPAATVKINAVPSNPVFAIVQPSCTVSTGRITISSPIAADLEYSIDGGVTYQSSPVFPTVTSGIAYTIIVRNVLSHCLSGTASGSMNPVLGVPAAPTGSVTIQPTCTTPTGTVTISAPLGSNLEYSNNGGLTYQASPVFVGLLPNTTYAFSVRDMVTTCVSSALSIIVNAIPANPIAATATILQPTCTAPTGAITITAPLGVDLEYSINAGTTYQSGLSFTGLVPNATYNIIVRNTVTGCVSVAAPFIVSPIPANPVVPVAIVTQPTCGVNTASFSVSVPLGSNFEYSIDGGTTYQTSVLFSGLTAATAYNLTVRNVVTGCVSNARVINILPTLSIPAAATASVTVQPTCTAPTARAEITAPLGANVQYSIDGGFSYQNSPIFNGLAPNTTISIIVRSTISGCVSSPSTITVNAIPAGPAAPIVTVIAYPDCYVPTGTFAVSPVGPTFQYSNNGGVTYQSSDLFTGLLPNTTYNFTVKDMVTGCVSAPTPKFVDPIPANPNAPVGTITQPNCNTTTATITITSPIGVNYQYSIDNGVTYLTSPFFTGLTPNTTYIIKVLNFATGCVSASSSFVVNPIPANPAAPVALVTQPTCAVSSGSFIINSPVGANLEYSIDNGTTYRSSASFTGLTAGSPYNVIVRNNVTGCISSTTIINILPALSVPAAPTVSATVQPNCIAPSGRAEVTAPLGVNLQYSINGGTTYQSSPVFTALAPNTTFNVTVKNMVSGCISTVSQVVINQIPLSPVAPTASNTIPPTCNTPTGTIVISAPLGATLEYSNNGGISYQSSTVFAGLLPNVSYPFTARDVVTGCVSLPRNVLVNPIPANPNAPTATLVQPTCTTPTGSITITAPTGSDLQYSIDGGITYQVSTSFAAIAPNATYQAMVKNSSTGCVSTITSLLINPTILPPATPVANGSNVCVDQSIMLSTPSVSGATYNWSGPNGFTSTNQNPVILNATTAMSGNYSVVIYLTPDCPSQPGIVSITVNPLPEPTLLDGSICIDPTNTVVNPYVLDSGLTDALYTFEWFTISAAVYTPIPLETLSKYSADAAGLYGVRATNRITGCVSAVVTATVNLSPTPQVIDVTTSDYFSDLQAITVTVFPTGNYQYQLDNGALQSSNVFTDVPSGEHNVFIKSECGEFNKKVNILDYPRYFTPNNDGYNDTWNIFSLSGQAKAKIYIFDRFGKLLKEISPAGTGWDGKFNQKNLPASDYWFIAHYEENNISKIFKSHFALKR